MVRTLFLGQIRTFRHTAINVGAIPVDRYYSTRASSSTVANMEDAVLAAMETQAAVAKHNADFEQRIELGVGTVGPGLRRDHLLRGRDAGLSLFSPSSAPKGRCLPTKG
jgi:hypothetical protein